MKLIFTGNKTLRQQSLEEMGEPTDLGEMRKQQTISTVNKLFGGGFEVPIEGLEIALDSTESKASYYVFEGGEIGKPELVQDIMMVVKTSADYKTEEAESVYFGRRKFVASVLDYLVQALAASPENKAAFDELQGKLREGWKRKVDYDNDHLLNEVCDGQEGIDDYIDGKVRNDLVKWLITFMMPDAPRISDTQVVLFKKEGSIYIADRGSVVGTWVGGEKIGARYDSWKHWAELDPHALAEKHGGEQSRFGLDVLGSNGYTLFGPKSIDSGGLHNLERVMNMGVVQVKDGSEITLGKETFGEDYKFVLRVD